MDFKLEKNEVALFKKNFLKAKPTSLEILKIKITSKCNSRCAFCGYWKSKKAFSLETKTIFDLLNSAKRLGAKKVTFSGGEPLLHPDIEKVVRAAFANDFSVTIITNGILFDEIGKKLLEHVKDNKLTIVFSVDGATKKMHDRIRGIKGSFEKIISAIDYINSLPNRSNIRIGISSTLSNRNFKELFGIIKINAKHKFDSLSFYPARAMVGENTKRINIGWMKRLRLEKQKLIKTARENHVNADNIERGLDTMEDRSCTYCFLPFFQVEVDTDGNVYACCHALENRSLVETTFGNMKEGGLNGVWTSKKAALFRKNCKDTRYAFCKDCIYKHLNQKVAKTINYQAKRGA